MDHTTDSQYDLFGNEHSDYTLASTLTVGSPLTHTLSAYHRPGYHRVTSFGDTDTEYRGAETAEMMDRDDGDLGDGDLGITSSTRGLGVRNFDGGDRSSIVKEPASSKDSPDIPGSTDLLISPPSRSSSRFGKNAAPVYEKVAGSHNLPTHRRSSPSIHEQFVEVSDTEELNKSHANTTMRPFNPQGAGAEIDCRSRRNIWQGRGNWLSVTILILAVYSSIFSFLWLLIALTRPRYGKRITSSGNLPPNTASLLAAAFAKTIELSFVTVFVAFLGQVLSRRAFVKRSKGVTIAEMSMRGWVMQPGTMITHWESVRHAGLSFLGAVALTAAFMAMLYTTASDALVSPKLKFGGIEARILYGQVSNQYAYPTFVQDRCQTPIQTSADPVYAGPTCIGLEHAGQAYHNWIQWLATWTENISNGSGSADLAQRPNGVGMLYDNTTVTASWIDVKNMTDLGTQYNRTITNVTMAMPHVGVFAAARDPLNDIIQPEDLNGLGEYFIEAAVPSPSVNVLCAGMTADELAPLVFTEWPDSGGPTNFNVSLWPNGYLSQVPLYPSYVNSTALDDLFGWGEKYNRRPPIFPRLPMIYNTLYNQTGWYADSVYVLGMSPTAAPEYQLCSLRGFLSPNCSTVYHASMAGGTMFSNCKDPKSKLAYRHSHPEAPDGFVNTDWPNIASEWGLALSLNSGLQDQNTSIARLLTQLIPTSNGLDPSLPSFGEALATLSGSTLLMGAQDSPFIHEWNYSKTVPNLAEPQYQAFNASLRFQDYSSGGVQHWQGIFYIVLFTVFATNIFCLVYFIMRRGLVTDFIEPQNLFSLSLNSPPSRQLAGSCGGGPESEQFRTNWFINVDNDHVYIENGPGRDVETPNEHQHRQSSRWKRKKHPTQMEYEGSPIMNTYSKLARKPASIL